MVTVPRLQEPPNNNCPSKLVEEDCGSKPGPKRRKGKRLEGTYYSRYACDAWYEYIIISSYTCITAIEAPGWRTKAVTTRPIVPQVLVRRRHRKFIEHDLESYHPQALIRL